MPHFKFVTPFGLLATLAALATSACTPGYMKAADLDRLEQGPAHCASRCKELGMEMGALVLVSNSLPGCVCQPQGTAKAPSAANEGAGGATAGVVVIAAAAAAHQQQQRQQQATYSTTHR